MTLVMSDPEPQRVARRKFHRAVFIAAALYNIGWGLLTSLDPQWLFRLADMEPLRYPDVFACVGMIVGLYGVVYFEVARRPELSFVLAAVGLVGKILGPIGWFLAYSRGEWPGASIIVILTNDLIWWIPFGLYLYDAWPHFRRDLRRGW
ncbi:MAG: hypothetical protein AAF488_08415 [Planctomycetota bacterium]